jgi:hypothetical protein
MKKPKTPRKLTVEFVRTRSSRGDCIACIVLMLQIVEQKERGGESPEQILRWVKKCFRDFQVSPPEARA